jgi:uncharacterized protein YndB with AHSA1/START domain
MDDGDARQVRVVRTIAGPREEVFRAWTEPELLKQWFGPGEFTIPRAELDLRAGGDYQIVMRPPAADAITLTGSYREIVAPERLIFTWSWRLMWAEAVESLVTVEFREVETGTEVTITHGDFGGESSAPYRTGWEGGLDKLQRLYPLAGAATV